MINSIKIKKRTQERRVDKGSSFISKIQIKGRLAKGRLAKGRYKNILNVN